MGKTYKGCFAAVFIFLDFLVLLLSYRITQAPGLYYIFTGIILLSTIFYIIYKLYPHFRNFLDDHVDIPFLYALTVLLCSLAFLRTGVLDLLALRNPHHVILSSAEFTMERHNIFHILDYSVYTLEGMDEEEEKLTLNIPRDFYNTYSYAVPAESLDKTSETQTYAYPETTLFEAAYLPGSRKVLSLSAQEIPEAEDSRGVSSLLQEETGLGSLQVKITSVIDYTTMEGTITDLKDYTGEELKKGDSVTIRGTMNLLYPYNIQGFYEIKEGDEVDFTLDSVSTENGILLETEYLNLITAP